MVTNSNHMSRRDPQPLEGAGVRASAVGMVDRLVAGDTIEEKLLVFDEVATSLPLLDWLEEAGAKERCLSPPGLATG